jgi:hypothetical protein
LGVRKISQTGLNQENKKKRQRNFYEDIARDILLKISVLKETVVKTNEFQLIIRILLR